MGSFNIKLYPDKIRFIIENLKEIENTNKDKKICDKARFIQSEILWSISRQCKYCEDAIEDSMCLHKENKGVSCYNCEIEYCPLLK